MYDNILNIEEHDDHINIVGLNEPYASTPNYTLTIPEIINDKKVVSISKLGSNNNLEKVVLPKTIERIEKDCFHWNTNLKEINLEDTNLKYIGENAFSACESLEKIKLPATCNVVDEAAFQHCKNLKEVDLSLTHMKYISAYAFRYCISLEDLKLPSDLKYIYINTLFGIVIN